LVSKSEGKYKFKVNENEVLRRISGPHRIEVAEG
jgi:hypothetical protein